MESTENTLSCSTFIKSIINYKRFEKNLDEKRGLFFSLNRRAGQLTALSWAKQRGPQGSDFEEKLKTLVTFIWKLKLWSLSALWLECYCNLMAMRIWS